MVIRKFNLIMVFNYIISAYFIYYYLSLSRDKTRRLKISWDGTIGWFETRGYWLLVSSYLVSRHHYPCILVSISIRVQFKTPSSCNLHHSSNFITVLLRNIKTMRWISSIEVAENIYLHVFVLADHRHSKLVVAWRSTQQLRHFETNEYNIKSITIHPYNTNLGVLLF